MVTGEVGDRIVGGGPRLLATLAPISYLLLAIGYWPAKIAALPPLRPPAIRLPAFLITPRLLLFPLPHLPSYFLLPCFLLTNLRPDHVRSTAHTLKSTRPEASPVSRTLA